MSDDNESDYENQCDATQKAKEDVKERVVIVSICWLLSSGGTCGPCSCCSPGCC